MSIKMITIVALFGTSTMMTQAQAECNSSLPYQELVDCIVVEGAGAEYKGDKELDFPVTSKTEENKKDTSNEIATNL